MMAEVLPTLFDELGFPVPEEPPHVERPIMQTDELAGFESAQQKVPARLHSVEASGLSHQCREPLRDLPFRNIRVKLRSHAVNKRLPVDAHENFVSIRQESKR